MHTTTWQISEGNNNLLEIVADGGIGGWQIRCIILNVYILIRSLKTRAD